MGEYSDGHLCFDKDPIIVVPSQHGVELDLMVLIDPGRKRRSEGLEYYNLEEARRERDVNISLLSLKLHKEAS